MGERKRMHTALQSGVGGAQAVREFTHHVPAEIWHLLDHVTEFLAVDDGETGRLAGTRRCRAALAVEQGNDPKRVAFGDRLDDPVAGDDVDRAAQHDIHVTRLVALTEHDITPVVIHHRPDAAGKLPEIDRCDHGHDEILSIYFSYMTAPDPQRSQFIPTLLKTSRGVGSFQRKAASSGTGLPLKPPAPVLAPLSDPAPRSSSGACPAPWSDRSGGRGAWSDDCPTSPGRTAASDGRGHISAASRARSGRG